MTTALTPSTRNESPRVVNVDVDDDDIMPRSPGKIKSLVGSWESRASGSSIGIPDVCRFAKSSPRSSRIVKTPMSPSSSEPKKSTRQTMEDLSVFVSPREIKKKFDKPIKSNNTNNNSSSSSSSPKTTSATASSSSSSSHEDSSTTPEPSRGVKLDEMPKIGSIRDRMKAFEQQHNGTPQAPWMVSQGPRGKRGSVLDRFTPKRVAKESVTSSKQRLHRNASGGEQEESLPRVNLLQQEDEDDDKIQTALKEGNFEEETTGAIVESVVDTPKDAHEMGNEQPEGDSAHVTLDDIKASIATVDDTAEESEEPFVDAVPERKAGNGKIDRDTLVLEEIRKMIRDTEDNEIEDDMDDEVKDCLEKAALQSPAYTRRWYDALSDSWIHCPSLATIIMDFTLIEAAEVLYGEELPMIYTVSLRAVASEVLSGEEELPDYVYRLAV